MASENNKIKHSKIEILNKFNLSKKGRLPIYQQIFTNLKQMITGGVLKPGDFLPTEIEFRDTLGINHITVRRALALLENEHLIVRKRRVGSIIESPENWKRLANSRKVAILLPIKSTGTAGDFGELDGYNRRVYSALCLEALNLDMDLVYLRPEDDKEHILKKIQEDQIEGVISFYQMKFNLLDLLKSMDIPKILLEKNSYAPDLDCIVIDSYDGVYHGVSEMIKKGHKDIAFIGGLLGGKFDSKGNQKFYLAQDSFIRYDIFRRCMQDHDLDYNKDRYFECSMDPEPLEDLIKDLHKKKNMPTAFVCFDDSIADFLIDALQKYKYEVPKDVSVLGFGGFSKRVNDNTLASTKIIWEEMAQLAVKRVYERITHGGLAGLHLSVSSTFVPGKSISKPRKP